MHASLETKKSVEKVSKKCQEWKELTVEVKILLLQKCQENLSKDTPEISQATIANNIAKAQKYYDDFGLLEASNAALLFYSMVSSRMQSILSTLQTKSVTGSTPLFNSRIDPTSGAIIASVYPLTLVDRLTMPGLIGYTGEVWMKPETEIPREKSVKEGSTREGFCLILASGSQESLVFCNVLDRLFLHQEVVVVKHSPLRAHLHDILSYLFSPLIAEDYLLSLADTGLPTAEMLLQHSSLQRVHLTGSGRTHDAVVAGLNARRDGDRIALSAALGCVTPWIVVPDADQDTGKMERWWAATLRHHAYHLATVLKANGSAHCYSPKALVLPRAWEQKEEFMHYLREALGGVPTSDCYYPGSEERWTRFTQSYIAEDELAAPGTPKSCELFSAQRGEKVVRSALLHVRLDSNNENGNRYALLHEALCPVLAVVELTCDLGPRSTRSLPEQLADYLATAARFCNDEIWGSLSCTLICPDTAGPAREALEAAVSALEYGSISVNCWSVEAQTINQCAWGGYQSRYRREAGRGDSGFGWGGNTLLLAEAEIIKSVVRAPFQNALQSTGTPPKKELVEIFTAASRQPTVVGAVFAGSYAAAKNVLSAVGWNF